jgi:hypothetical protein
MTKTMFGLILGAGLVAALPASAAQYGITAPQTLLSSVTTVQYDDRYCRRLRRACEFKHERGEAGEGNCRRYRRECGRRWR